jgi:hypothetical protein
MPLTKKRLLRFTLLLVLAGVLLFAFTPFVVAKGLRFWIWWKARQQKLTVKIEAIDAPLLRPVVIRGFHLSSLPDSACRIDISALRATLDLNFQSILLRTRGPAIRTLSVEGLHAEVHRNRPGESISEGGWNTLQKMLPENLALDRCDMRIEDGPSVILLREMSLRASQIEDGPFSAAEVRIDSPLFRQTFLALRGLTRWQGDRLTVAGLSLARGLDLQSITADLSGLSKQRIGLEFDVDTFGGKLRANVSSEWHSQNTSWNVIASATDLSLRQTSQGLGFTDRLDGVVHACKFTFRGDPHDPTNATASLWAELTGLSWRNRAADVIMLGAALYNRQIQLQQFYVKQRDNQLTLNGEAAFPGKSFDWLNPDFRGNISASIANLGDFASLFGANPGDFAGQIAVEGTMNAGSRKLGGHLTATGKSLSIFKSPVDTFAAKANWKTNELEIEQLDAQRQTDLLHAQGKIDLGPEHTYSGAASLTAANIAQYLRLLPVSWNASLAGGTVKCDWSGNGNAKSHSGKFHVNGRGIRLARSAELLPFNADLDADYSPGNFFFRQAHLANEHASINGFVTIASKYLQLQAIAVDVNGKPKLRGNAFVPVALSKWWNGASLLDALDPGQKVDVDLAIESSDLAEVSEALCGQSRITGNVATRLSIFGGLDALQGWSEMHLRDFAMTDDPARTSADVETRFVSGTMTTKANAQFRDSSPLKLEASVPVRLGEQRSKATAEPFSGSLDFPKISVARLPHFLSRDWLRDGIFSGKLAFSETLQHPKILGDVQLTSGIPGSIPLKANDLSGKINFKGTTASIDSLNLVTKSIDVPLRGEIDFSGSTGIAIKLTGSRPLFDLTPAEDDSCIQEVALLPRPVTQTDGIPIDEIQLVGNLGHRDWAVSLHHRSAGPSTAGGNEDIRSFKFCSVGDTKKTLTLGCEPLTKSERTRPRKKSRRR